MEEKTFGELKKGDTIYFYHQDMYEGPGVLREYVLEHDPSSICGSSIKEYAIRLNGEYLYEGLEFPDDNVSCILNLRDYDYNCMHYGNEYWHFSPDKEHILRKRKEMIEEYIFRTETTLNKLKTKLENHIKEYGNIGF